MLTVWAASIARAGTSYLPEHAVVSPGWVTQTTFLTGYGFAQAIPGPLFTSATFLGSAIQPAGSRVGLGVVALIAIFLPGLLAMVVALSFWSPLRKFRRLQTALPEVNASVLGVLAADFVRPVCSTAIRNRLEVVDPIFFHNVPAVSTTFSEDERLIYLERCLRRLPSFDSQLLKGYYLSGGGAISARKNMAERLGVSPGTLRQKVFLIRRRLLECVTAKLEKRKSE